MKKQIFYSAGILLIIFGIVLTLLKLNTPVTVQAEGKNSSYPITIVLSDPQDDYYPLAEKISSTENIPLVSTLEDAINLQPLYLLWVINPQNLSDESFTNFGIKIREAGITISSGLITGSTIEYAEALWQREQNKNGILALSVSREKNIYTYAEGEISTEPLDVETLVAAVQKASYMTIHGHGSRKGWWIEEEYGVKAADIQPLNGTFLNVVSCQTLKIWGEDSIALKILDEGAAGYAGFVHSPFGYLIGEPHDFPYRYSWQDFPIGTIVQIQDAGLLKGFMGVPSYFLLGDPRRAFEEEAPYSLLSDQEDNKHRILTYTNAPAGVIPLRIENGAAYDFVEIKGTGQAAAHESFYNHKIQFVDISGDRYLLFKHSGGDFQVTLSQTKPFLYHILGTLKTSIHHSLVISNTPDSYILNIPLILILLLVLFVRVKKGKMKLKDNLLPALLCAFFLIGLRFVYTWLNQDNLSGLYENYIRVDDLKFEISFPMLLFSLLLSLLAFQLFFNLKARGGRLLTFLLALSPTWFISLFWLGAMIFLNSLANSRYGFALYGYGGGLTHLVTFGFESLLLLVFILTLKKFGDSLFVHDKN